MSYVYCPVYPLVSVNNVYCKFQWKMSTISFCRSCAHTLVVLGNMLSDEPFRVNSLSAIKLGGHLSVQFWPSPVEGATKVQDMQLGSS